MLVRAERAGVVRSIPVSGCVPGCVDEPAAMWETTFPRLSHAGLDKPVNEYTILPSMHVVVKSLSNPACLSLGNAVSHMASSRARSQPLVRSAEPDEAPIPAGHAGQSFGACVVGTLLRVASSSCAFETCEI